MENKDIIEAEYEMVVVEGENLPSTDVKYTAVDAEFEYARANIVTILQESKKVLNETAEMVSDAEHPSMVNAYSGLVKTLVDANKSLLDIREKKMKIKGELADVTTPMKGKTSTTNVTNNTIFVGSTDELIQAMKG